MRNLVSSAHVLNALEANTRALADGLLRDQAGKSFQWVKARKDELKRLTVKIERLKRRLG